METRPISNADVEAYWDMVASLARRYNGHCGAEYDDLFQEGMLVVLVCIKRDTYPSKDHIAHRMRRWVSKCRQEGRVSLEEDDEFALFN